jgi:6-phosphogluconate dehydrogenase
VNPQSGKPAKQFPLEPGLSAPELLVSSRHLDADRGDWLPPYFIKAQRDDLGTHTYERVDQKRAFHTQWEKF